MTAKFILAVSRTVGGELVHTRTITTAETLRADLIREVEEIPGELHRMDLVATEGTPEDPVDPDAPVKVLDAHNRRRVLVCRPENERGAVAATLIAIGPRSSRHPKWAKVRLSSGAFLTVPYEQVSLLPP